MAGSRPDSLPVGILAAGLAYFFFALGETACAQGLGLPTPAPASRVFSSGEGLESSFLEPADPQFSAPISPPAFFPPVSETAQDPQSDEQGLLESACDSLFGDAYAEGKWRPLYFRDFFRDGWCEPWAAAPAGRDGLTPRHGWLASFDGVFYRLWLATYSYSNDINTPFGGNRSAGTYSIFLPLSRRFEVALDIPFVTSNRTPTVPHDYTSRFGDFTVTPRVLLSESAATTQSLALAVRTPTGTPETGGGITALMPRYEFWTNPGGAWVVRGAGGFFLPVAQSGTNVPNAFTGGLAVGRYLTPHDAPLGDLVLYAASSILTPIGDGNSSQTLVTVGPGTRFHMANNYFFLAELDFPVSNAKAADYTFQVALLKVF